MLYTLTWFNFSEPKVNVIKGRKNIRKLMIEISIPSLMYVGHLILKNHALKTCFSEVHIFKYQWIYPNSLGQYFDK